MKNILWVKTLKSSMIAGAGALLAVLVSSVGSLDFGIMAPLVTAGLSVLVNLVKEWQKQK